jgi:hypothetical protein
VQLFGTTVHGSTTISGTTADVTTAGNTFMGEVVLSGNTQVSANERFSRLAGAYGPILAGNRVIGSVSCTGNSADASDFGAGNSVNGTKTGQCAGL